LGNGNVKTYCSFSLISSSFYTTLWFEISDIWLFCGDLSAVVNLTLIDLPGLTKVAVGKPEHISQYFNKNWVAFLEDLSKSLTYTEISATFTEGQQESIVQDIENMVRSYVEKVIIFLIWREEGSCHLVLHNLKFIKQV
jgi:hypothetical protein